MERARRWRRLSEEISSSPDPTFVRKSRDSHLVLEANIVLEYNKRLPHFLQDAGIDATSASMMAVYLIVIMDFLGASLQLSVMPYYVASLGGNAADVGHVITASAVGVILSQLWMGLASDKYGRRAVLLFAAASTSIGMICSACAWSPLSLGIIRFLQGCTSGTYAVGQSYIADTVEPRVRAQKMAQLGGMQGLVFMVGPLIGSALTATVSDRGVFVTGGAFAFLGKSLPGGGPSVRDGLVLPPTTILLTGRTGLYCLPHTYHRPTYGLLTRPPLLGAASHLPLTGLVTGYNFILARPEVELLQRLSPSAQARRRWKLCQDVYLTNTRVARAEQKKPASHGVRWGTISVGVAMATASSIVQSTVYVIVALGPLVDVGLGQGTYGSLLTLVGCTAATMQLVIYPRVLLPRLGLHACGAIGSLIYLAAQLAWMAVGRLGACSTPDDSVATCLMAQASVVDLVMLGVGTVLFGTGYTLTQTVVAPVLVAVAPVDRRGFIVGLGGLGNAVGRALGPMVFGHQIASTSGAPLAFSTACVVCAVMCAAWTILGVGECSRPRHELSPRARLLQVIEQVIEANRNQVHNKVRPRCSPQARRPHRLPSLYSGTHLAAHVGAGRV